MSPATAQARTLTPVESARHELPDRPPAAWRGVVGHTHTHSGRPDHGGTVPPPESYRRLVAWCQQHDIQALGMGSPYTPELAEHYHTFEGPRLADYYAGAVEREPLRADAALRHMLAEVNALTDDTWFYLDNETPKNRFGHMWWFGYHNDAPAWHDFDQPYDRWMLNRCPGGNHDDEPTPFERRTHRQVLAVQRRHGALGVWAHPTSWWWGSRGQFITNLAAEMPAHAIADGHLDAMVVMGYHAWRPQYARLWWKLLDAGYRVTGVAEMDVGLSQNVMPEGNRVYRNLIWSESPLAGVNQLTDAVGRGHVVASSGPIVSLSIDGHPMGGVCRTDAARRHRVVLEAWPAPGVQRIARLELIGPGGVTLWSGRDVPPGRIELDLPGSDRRGWLLPAAFDHPDGSAATDFRALRHVALGNPVYLHPAGTGFAPPAQSVVTLELDHDSPWRGATLRAETMTGDTLETHTLTAGQTRLGLPSAALLTLESDRAGSRTLDLVSANRPLVDLMRELYRGRFVQQDPTLQPGEAPPHCWDLDAYAHALAEVTLRPDDLPHANGQRHRDA